ncbi:MAG: S4 domain-containing protein [archaeon]
MHIKKSKMPTAWPIPRKGKRKRFIAVPSHAVSKGISLLFILRDILDVAKTRKEVRYMALNGFVKINNKIRKDENFPLQVFDVVNLEKSGKNYRLEIVNKKYSLKEISDKEAGQKIVKIIGKKVLKEGKVQMNLDDGQNIITNKTFSVGDSAILNTIENKLEKILPLKKGASIEIIGGKHAGEKGELVDFVKLARGKSYVVKLNGKETALPFKTILVIE